MEFDKEFYKAEFERLLKEKEKRKFFIKKSNALFKINKFIKKGTDSFELANFIKSIGNSSALISFKSRGICAQRKHLKTKACFFGR